jgi:phage tail tape-measure protein
MTMMTIESAFNLIWRVRKPRPFAQRVLAYWALITLGPLLFGVSLSLSSYLFTQSLAFTGAAPSTSIIEWLLALASLPLTVLAFTLLYVYLPNCTVAWRDAVIGGLFAAVAFELAKRGFGYYVRRIPTYTAVYGVRGAARVPAVGVPELVHRAARRDGRVRAAGDPSASFIASIIRAAICSTRSNCSRGSPRRARPAGGLHGAAARDHAALRHGDRAAAAADDGGARMDRAAGGGDQAPRYILLANPIVRRSRSCSTCW